MSDYDDDSDYDNDQSDLESVVSGAGDDASNEEPEPEDDAEDAENQDVDEDEDSDDKDDENEDGNSDEDADEDSEDGDADVGERKTTSDSKVISTIEKKTPSKSTTSISNLTNPSEKEVKSVLLANENVLSQIFIEENSSAAESKTEYSLPTTCVIATSNFITNDVCKRYEMTAIIAYLCDLYDENPNILPSNIREEIAKAVATKKLPIQFGGYISNQYVVIAAVFLKLAPICIVRRISDTYAEKIPISQLTFPLDDTEQIRASI